MCFQTLSTSNWLVCSAVMVLLQGDKMIALLWQLTTMRMLSYPFDVGRLVMKSIVIVSHGPSGISVGFSGTLTGGRIFVV
jgi:formate/nitrite transporter FocA (FNT family)